MTAGLPTYCFRAMDTDIGVILPEYGVRSTEYGGPPGPAAPAGAEAGVTGVSAATVLRTPYSVLLARARALFAEAESALSRFRPESELCALNRSAGRPFRASPLLFAAVAEALAAAERTGGLFDPTILADLEAAGYDRTFGEVRSGECGVRGWDGDSLPQRERARVRARPRTPDFGLRTSDFRAVRLDPRTRTIELPPGLRLDLGGIGKGWTVDRAAALLAAVPNWLVNAGGDLYARGEAAPGEVWRVAVEDPRRPGEDLTTLAVRDRAVATSGRNRRRWVKDGRPQHHLIDPRTGRPAAGDALAATVVAGGAARAETAAKAAFLLGMDAGLRYLEGEPDLEGLLVGVDGEVRWTAGLERYFGVD